MFQENPPSVFKPARMPKHKHTREEKIARMNTNLGGEGEYIFENNSTADLFLPRATKTGLKRVGPRGQFTGDSYYFQMVKTHELKFIKEVSEGMEHLITEQPPVVTRDGQVEFVTPTPEKKINENDKNKQEDVLLTESPVDGIKIIS